MKSQDDREKERKVVNFLTKVKVEEKNKLFSEIKKGKNPFGGTYGSPDKTPEGYGFGNGGRT
jgi:hypothetical protein